MSKTKATVCICISVYLCILLFPGDPSCFGLCAGSAPLIPLIGGSVFWAFFVSSSWLWGMFTTWQRTVIRLKSIWWFRGKQNTEYITQQAAVSKQFMWFLQIWDVLVAATNNDHSGRTAFGLSLAGAIGGNTALSALVGGRLPCMSERVRTITQKPSGMDFNVGSGRSGSTTVIFISEASSGETGDSRQTLTRPLNIRNCILHHITVAKEKLQTKRGTVLVRFHGAKPHCKSSGDNTSGQPRFAPKVPFMNKNNFENVEKTLNIIHFHRIFHYKPSSYWGIPVSPFMEIPTLNHLAMPYSLAGHPRSATPDASFSPWELVQLALASSQRRPWQGFPALRSGPWIEQFPKASMITVLLWFNRDIDMLFNQNHGTLSRSID